MTEGSEPLSGKTALVTGAAKRLGREIALALAGDGANVIVHYNRSMQPAAETAEEIRALARRAWTIPADLSDPEQAERLMDRAVAQAGPVDVLVNNASAFPSDRLLETTPQDIAASVQVHAIAPLLLSRALARQGRGGHVVNLLDSRVTDYDAAHAAYHLGKRLLFSLTRMLALELAPEVAVNAVAPGLILPPAGEDESFLERMAGTNPMGRHGSPRGVTEAVLFLLRSDFITGQVIYVDGGRHMKGRVYG